jgi:CDP-4-dehydro-6-deoxyglucose reductase
VRVSLSKSDRSFSVAPERPVLEAALDAGLNLPHSCKGGNCGACRVRLLEGEVSYPNGRPLGLSDAEVADGFILLCQARAVSD